MSPLHLFFSVFAASFFTIITYYYTHKLVYLFFYLLLSLSSPPRPPLSTTRDFSFFLLLSLLFYRISYVPILDIFFPSRSGTLGAVYRPGKLAGLGYSFSIPELVYILYHPTIVSSLAPTMIYTVPRHVRPYISSACYFVASLSRILRHT